MIERFVVDSDGVRLSALIWRRFQTQKPGLVERVLDLNPGIAEKGPLLPVGTVVRVPIERPTPTALVAVVKLWD